MISINAPKSMQEQLHIIMDLTNKGKGAAHWHQPFGKSRRRGKGKTLKEAVLISYRVLDDFRGLWNLSCFSGRIE
jgi:hypothetical protein